MDKNKRNLFKRPQTNQFKRIGVSKKGRWNNVGHEEPLGNSPSGDTVYRMLCPSKKIGGVIGKGGNIIKALREETQAKITVADPVPGSDERVIIVYSSSAKISRKQNKNDDLAHDNEELMEPQCAAQDALMKVHQRIVEEDSFGGMASDDDNENSVVTARLLVANNMVGCLLGRGGDVIQRLRSETGASIRVLPADQLPSCATSTDELVQISGRPDVAKKALYQVSTLLHQNPRKDKPVNFPMPYGGQDFHPPGGPMMDMPPPGNAMFPRRNSVPDNMQPMPWSGEYGTQPSGYAPSGFSGTSPGHGGEPLVEFSMKILCPVVKIGGVIGKGGSNIRLVQQESGASIHVEDASAESDERVICVSAFEALQNPRSQTIEAILQLQNKTSELSEKGTVTTRLLVPSSKVGCILGQGGQVINEMRRRTLADIRVYSKDDKPPCASENEELVQISGNFAVAKDALAEIAARLRMRTLRDASSQADARLVRPVQGFGPAQSFSGRGRPPSGLTGSSSTSGFENLRGGGHEYESPSFPVPPAASRYPTTNSAMEVHFSNNGVDPGMRSGGGGGVFSIREVAGTRMKLQHSPSRETEYRVDSRGSAEHLNATQITYQAHMAASGQSMSARHGHYQNSMYSQQSPYESVNPHQMSYQNVNPLQNLYSSTAQQGVYTDLNASQGGYRNISMQQGVYDYGLGDSGLL